MRKSVTLAFCLLCLTLLARDAAAQAARAGSLSVEPYTLRTYDGQGHEAELGRLWVRENRASRSARLIRLAFVRLKTTAQHPAAPVVWLAGGPGVPGVGMARVPVYFSLFDKLREVSDVILLDQRGTGMSEPNLDCERAPVPADAFASEQAWLRAYTGLTRACDASWRAKGVETSAYTADASADDLDDLRQALGAERLSLVGHSYGTVLAQEYVRRHGERVERVVFANTEGEDNLVALPGVWDLLIRKLAYFAGRDPAAAKNFPDVESLYRRALDRLEREPASITVTDARTKRPAQLRVGKIGLQFIVRTDMADARTYSALPALFQLIERGDYSVFTKQIEALYNDFAGRSPMANAADCSVGWSAERLARARGETRGALFSNVNLQWSSGVCESMGVAGRYATPQARLWSEAPALFLSGTLDTNTPPFQAEELRWGFPASVHLVVENGGHETLPSEEVQSIVVDFFKGADVSARRVRFDPPRFLSVEELKARGAGGGRH